MSPFESLRCMVHAAQHMYQASGAQPIKRVYLGRALWTAVMADPAALSHIVRDEHKAHVYIDAYTHAVLDSTAEPFGIRI